MTEQTESVQERIEKAKMVREERKSRTSDDFELVDSTDGENGSMYTSLVTRKLLTIDLSNQSTYTQLGIGGATGWITGYMVGKVGKACAAAVGGSILLINMGTRAGYITVDWEKVDTDMRTTSEQVGQKIVEHQSNQESQKLLDKTVIFVKRNLVMVGGFAAGFFLGIAS